MLFPSLSCVALAAASACLARSTSMPSEGPFGAESVMRVMPSEAKSPDSAEKVMFRSLPVAPKPPDTILGRQAKEYEL